MDFFKPDNALSFSIITATYNRAKTIRRALSSIKSQSYKNIQIIVIDGGSTDGTIECLGDFLGNNDILLSEPDNGIYEALNKGLALAKGDIVGFLHSDDILLDSNVVSNIANILCDHEYDIVYGDAIFFDEGSIDKVTRVYRSKNLSVGNLAWGHMPAHTAMYMRRSVYQKVGFFDTTFKIAGDYDFLCRVVKIKGLKYLHIPKPFVRMQYGGASTLWRNRIRLNVEVLTALKKNGIYSNIFMVLSKYFTKIFDYIK